MWRHKINLINFKSQAGSRQVLRGLQNLALRGGGTLGSWQLAVAKTLEIVGGR